MRSYKYKLYVWHDEENDGLMETDSLWEVIKWIWKERHNQFVITWTKAKRW